VLTCGGAGPGGAPSPATASPDRPDRLLGGKAGSQLTDERGEVSEVGEFADIRSASLLLSGIGRLTHHGGQSRLTITALHGKAAHAKAILMRVSERLKAWKSAAEQ
jgi:hypothetical protein